MSKFLNQEREGGVGGNSFNMGGGRRPRGGEEKRA